MKEIWKPVVGYEGIYEVSSLGRVKSLARTDCRGNRRNERIRKPEKANGAYITIYLSKHSKVHRRTLHSVIAETFLGPRPSGRGIDHIDGDKLNNRADNLEYVTSAENTRRYYQNLRKSGVVGVNLDKRSGKWCAKFRRKHIGYFKTEQEAIKAKLKAEKEYNEPN